MEKKPTINELVMSLAEAKEEVGIWHEALETYANRMGRGNRTAAVKYFGLLDRMEKRGVSPKAIATYTHIGNGMIQVYEFGKADTKVSDYEPKGIKYTRG